MRLRTVVQRTCIRVGKKYLVQIVRYFAKIIDGDHQISFNGVKAVGNKESEKIYLIFDVEVFIWKVKDNVVYLDTVRHEVQAEIHFVYIVNFLEKGKNQQEGNVFDCDNYRY